MRAPDVNLEGDWFPGWRGCYSPSLSPLQIELLEGGMGRVVLSEKYQNLQRKSARWLGGADPQ